MSVYAALIRYRELFANLFRRDLHAKYRGSVLGVVWSLALPLMLMAVYALVFSLLLRVAGAIEDYPLFLLSGLATWLFFTGSLVAAASSIVTNAPLVTKVRFPRQLVPFSVVGTQLVTLGVMLGALIVVNAILRPETRDTVLLAVPLSALFVALVCGLSLAVASLNVLYRDVEHLLSVLLLPWFFVTPVLYSFDQLPEDVARKEMLIDVLTYGNFVTPPVLAIRDVLFWGRLPRLVDVVYLAVAAVVALVVGALVFRRTDDQIAVEL